MDCRDIDIAKTCDNTPGYDWLSVLQSDASSFDLPGQSLRDELGSQKTISKLAVLNAK